MINKLVKIKRGSIDILLFGKKNQGKTLIQTMFGYLLFKKGYEIFTNYNVNFPHTRIKTLQDLKNITELPYYKKKVFLGDDFERWINARLTRKNIDINSITLDFGKSNCTTIVNCKRLLNIDIIYRMGVSYFIDVKLIKKFEPINNLEKRMINNYLNYYMIQLDIYDYYGDLVKTYIINNIQNYVNLFETIEKVKTYS